LDTAWIRLGPGKLAVGCCIVCMHQDGHEELVRGAVFNELDVRALRK